MRAFCPHLPLTLALALSANAQDTRSDQPRVSPDAIVARETKGFVVVEAEHFFAQTKTEKRAWHISDAATRPSVGRDIDPPNFASASGGASIEVLPDEGNDGTPPVPGLSIANEPGTMAVVSWRVQFKTPGRYYIWSRAFGTDGDDNTLHYGLNGTWPDSSARSHTFGGKKWQWANRHRQHKGKLFFEISTPGPHVITASMREDGCELDQFVLTTDETWSPPADHAPVGGRVPTESNGLLVVEAEDLLPSPGWELRQDASGHTGEGYIAWTLPRQGRPAGEGVLRLGFRITTPGNYQFLWRTRLPDPSSRPDTRDPDGNDTWVRFLSGADVPGHATMGGEWRKVALFDHPTGWSWSTHADPGKPHPDTPVCRRLEAGIHVLELSGRSHGHQLDRLVLRRFNGPDTISASSDEATLSRSPVSEIH